MYHSTLFDVVFVSCYRHNWEIIYDRFQFLNDMNFCAKLPSSRRVNVYVNWKAAVLTYKSRSSRFRSMYKKSNCSSCWFSLACLLASYYIRVLFVFRVSN